MPWSSIKPLEFTDALEKSGEAEVRAALVREDKWVTLEGRSKIAEDWLLSKENARRDAREAMSLSISQEANDIASKASSDARRANNIAISAIILSTITAIISMAIQFKWLP